MSRRALMIPRTRIALIIAGLALAVAAAVLGVIWHSTSSGAKHHADASVSTCSTESDRGACYERVVPNLYPRLPVAQVFDVIRLIRKEDPLYQFCHVLAHKVGERVVAEDPERWIDAIPLNPSDGLCSNGFIHGVVGGRFRSEVLDDKTLDTFIPQFARACEPRAEWDPSGLDQAICYHGLGHLYDFITNANIPKALDVCTRTTTPTYRRVCIEGVFMQIYQPLEPDDYLMIEQMPVKPTKATVRQFCASFENPDYVGACLRESWPLFHEEIFEHAGTGAFCSGQPNAKQEDICYESTSSIIGRISLEDPQKAAKTCDTFPVSRRGACYSASAGAVLEENRMDAAGAILLCGMGSGNTTRQCFDYLISRAQFTFGNNAREHELFCKALPASHKERCLRSR